MKRFLIIAIAVSLSASSTRADQPPDDAVTSTVKLPAHLGVPAGQLSVVADPKKEGDLYLVNRTGKSVEVWTNLGKLFITVEYQAQPGKWLTVRVTDGPQCGNDLKVVKLPNETYLAARGCYLTTGGFKASVRFRVDTGGKAKPVSNAIVALVSHDELSWRLVTTTKDFRLLSKVALGEFVLPTEAMDCRPRAIARLSEAQFGFDKSEAVLKQIVKNSDQRYARVAQQAVEEIRTARLEEAKRKADQEALRNARAAWRATQSADDLKTFTAQADVVAVGRIVSEMGENGVLIQVNEWLKGEKRRKYASNSYFLSMSVPSKVRKWMDRETDYLLFLAVDGLKSNPSADYYPRIQTGDGIVIADRPARAAVKQALDRK